MNVQQIRSQFPSLSRNIKGQPIVYLDGPAGTQVPNMVIDAISHYYRHSNANTHGMFAASEETDQMMDQTRQKVADFLNAPSSECISFGQNMTTLNFSLSKALVRSMKAGDEIIITELDHEANRGPWLNLREYGIVVKEVTLLPNGTLDYEDLEGKISPQTKLVCLGLASNIFGTVNDVAKVRALTHGVGAKLLLDAVHYAPHYSIDVQSLDCDFLLCSAYKFYGPHVGILYTRPGLLNTLKTDFLRTQSELAPYRIETGTLNHAALAGVGAALDFVRSTGKGDDPRAQMVDAMHQIHTHEADLARKLASGLSAIDGLTIYGPSFDVVRTPTLAFTIDDMNPEEVCRQLGEEGIYAWQGHFYALKAVEALDLLGVGGVTRMGIVAYNHEADIERTISATQRIARIAAQRIVRSKGG